MIKLNFVTASALVALASAGVATGVQAADLIIDEPAPYVEPAVSGLYIQGFVGAALAGAVTWNGDDDFDEDLGWAVGGAIGWNTGLEGLSLELDLLHTHRAYSLDSADTLSTTSLMANAKYTFHLNDTFDIYAGAGLGGIHLNYDEAGYIYSGWGFGYQFMVGASAHVTEDLSVFAEFRHQNSFDDIDVGDGQTLRAPINAVLVGLKLDF